MVQGDKEGSLHGDGIAVCYAVSVFLCAACGFPLGRCRQWALTDEVEYDLYMVNSLARGFIQSMNDDSFDEIIHDFPCQFPDVDIFSYNNGKLFEIKLLLLNARDSLVQLLHLCF